MLNRVGRLLAIVVLGAGGLTESNGKPQIEGCLPGIPVSQGFFAHGKESMYGTMYGFELAVTKSGETYAKECFSGFGFDNLK